MGAATTKLFLLTSARRERAWTLYIEGAEAEIIEDGATEVSKRGKII